MCVATEGNQNSETDTVPSLPSNSLLPRMASAGARDPPPPPPPERPGGWLAGLVSGAGRILAAVLGPDSPASGSASSSPESSQSPPPPLGSGDHGNGAHFASSNYQSGMKIVLKDCGQGSLAVISEIDPKNAITQLLMQETYSRSECDTLIKIIQERVVDSDPGVLEPAVILPIAWQAGSEQDPAAYSSFSLHTSHLVTSSVPEYSQEFNRSVVDMKTSIPVEVPCTSNTDRSQQLVLKRSYLGTGDTLNEPLRIRPKLNGSDISKNQADVLICPAAMASFEEPNTKDPNTFKDRDIPVDSRKLFTNTPLHGMDNLTFSHIVLNGHTANDITRLHDKLPTDIIETFPIKTEPLDGLVVPLEPDLMDLAQKNHNTRTVGDDSGSVSKLMFQEDIKGARSSSTGLTLENSSMNCIRGANLQKNAIAKGWSPVTNVGQEANLGHIQSKRPVGRPRKVRRGHIPIKHSHF